MKPEPTAAELNALLDGELSAEDAAGIRAAIAASATLQHRFTQLRRLRGITQLALRDDRPRRAARNSWRRYGMVAAIGGGCFAIGLALGWQTREPLPLSIQVPPQRVATGAASRIETSQALVHIGGGAAQTIATGLDRAEQLLESHRAAGRPLQVEVLLNGGGLIAVRADASPYRARIARLQQRYPNVAFIACKQTLERLKLERGLEPGLLPGVTITPSALDQVVHRLGQGWTYIRV